MFARIACLLLCAAAFIQVSANESRRYCNERINYLLVREQIEFDPGTSNLRSTNLGVVDSIAEIAAWCPAADIIVEGHTDDRGDAALNAALSLARARAVADALAARGIRHERLISRGLGSSKPIADNATRDGRAKNRRIEIRFAVGDA